MRRRVYVIAGIAAALALAIAAGSLLLTRDGPQRRAAEGGTIRTSGEADIGGPFSLVDQNGERRTSADFRGRYMLVFFGYTHCPDFCPTTLQTVSQMLDRLGPLAEEVQPVFISIDPERDRPQLLKDYSENFHSAIVYLTGTPEEIRDAARAYRVYYSRQEVEGGNSDAYLMNHSTFTYLMDRDGELAEIFPYGTQPAQMADRIRARIEGRATN